MFFRNFLETHLRICVAVAWLLCNLMLFSGEFLPSVWATNCDKNLITNNTDCAVTQNTNCELKCNNTCPAAATMKIYTGNSHKVMVTGGSSKADTTTFVNCWDDYTCATAPSPLHKCRNPLGVLLFCDPNWPLNNCNECLKGTPTPQQIANHRIKPCDEE